MKKEKRKSQKKALTFLKEKKNLFFFSMNNGKKKKLKMKNKNKNKVRHRNQSKESVLDRKCWFCLAQYLLCFVNGGVKR